MKSTLNLLQKGCMFCMFLLVWTITPKDANAQNVNYVPNGSFENFSALPDDDCDWALATGWTNAATTSNCDPSNGTPDYYHLLGTGPFSALPDNYFANVLPFDGDAVMGISGGITFSPNVREYISTQLCSPLVVGESYTLKFSMTVGNPNVGGFYSNGWGAALSTAPLLQTPGTSNPLTGANQFTVPGLLFNSTSWQTYTFNFVANAAHQYITLGNFVPNATQVTQFYGTQGFLSIAYIFIDDISIISTDAVDLTVSLDDVEICAGELAQLNALVQGGIPPYTYTWTPNIGNTSSPTVSPATTTTYTVEVTDCAGNIATASATVIVNDEIPAVDLGPDQQLCGSPAVITLNATTSGAQSYLWNTGSTDESITVSAPGTYSVTVTGSCGDVTDEVVIEECINDLTVNIEPNAAICLGEQTTVAAVVNGGTPPYSFNWIPNIGSGPGPFTVTPVLLSNYTVEVTDANGNTATDLYVVDFITENLSIDLGPDFDLCGGPILLNASTPGAQSYLWNTGASTPTLQVVAPGTYSVTVTSICGSVTDEVVVTECIPELTVSLGPTEAICPGENATLLAQVDGGLPPYTYSWTPNVGVGAGPFLVSPAVNTTYSVEVTDAQGTVAFTTKTVTVTNENLDLDLGPDFDLCNGAVLLDGTTPGAQSYQWSSGQTAQAILVAFAGTYELTVTGFCGSDTDEVVVTECIPELTVSLGPTEAICPGENATLLAQVDGGLPPYTYSWTPNVGVGAGLFLVSPAVNTTYSVEVTDAQGTVASTTKTVTVVNENLSLSLDANVDLCGGPVLLDATTPGAQSYLWNTGQTTPSITANAPGSYSVDVNGNCTSVAAAASVAPCILPLQVAIDGNLTLCPGSSTTLNTQITGGVPPYNLTWVAPVTLAGNNPVVTPSSTSAYTANVTDAEGRSATATIVVSILNENLSLNLGPDSIWCVGSTLVLEASAPGAISYLWNTGSSASTIEIRSGGTYWLTATGQCASVTDTIQVDAVDERLNYATTVRLCNDQDVSIGPVIDDVDIIVWSDGKVGSPLLVESDGIYEGVFSGRCGVQSIRVDVEPFTCNCDIYVPTAFSPNSDGLNDLFGPVIDCVMLNYEFAIFNRWGVSVFRTSDPSARWNGSFDGQDYFSENSMYVWYLKAQPANTFSVSQPIDLKGTVTLLR